MVNIGGFAPQNLAAWATKPRPSGARCCRYPDCWAAGGTNRFQFNVGTNDVNGCKTLVILVHFWLAEERKKY
jgi:hypothetical protein